MAGPTADDNIGILLESLTDDQRKLLFEFCDATAMDDLSAAVSALRSNEWNLGQTIQSFFEPDHNSSTTHTNEHSIVSGLRHRSTAARSDQHNGANSNSQRPARRTERSLNRPSFALMPLVAWPFMLFAQVSLFFIRGFLTLIGLGRIAAAGIPGADLSGNTTSVPRNMSGLDSRDNDTTSDAAQIRDYFESIYGDNHPPFFADTYSRALEAARRELKYLIVILWSKEHDDSDKIGQTLVHPDVVEFLSHSRFIVWIGDVSRAEAYGAATRLGVTAYPFVGLAALKPEIRLGTGSSSRFRLQIVARIDGLPGNMADLDITTGALARDLIRRLSIPIEANEQSLQAARRQQEARDADRRLREQQNAAYEASLARDRERERLAREREESEHLQRAEEERREQERQNWENWREQWRWATLARIVRQEKENSATPGGSDSDLVDEADPKNGSVGRFMLRLEDGTRLVKTFPASATMQDVFDFVETRSVAKEWESLNATPYGEHLDMIQPPEGYKHEYDFALISQFPRVVFDDTSAVLGEVMSAKGLWPSAALIVEPIFESEDEHENGGDEE
ncbi:Ubx domain-containing protein [Coemansia sp. RSA 1200]|nr:Ubx domain-containing protein [Coemansia sp. RSA 1200]